MTDYTIAELATRVLKDLGLVGSDETPSSEDLNDTVEIINSEVASMSARRLDIWGALSDAIPQEYLSPLSRRLGLSVAPMFGMPVEGAVNAIEMAERYLRQISAKPADGSIVETEYY